MTGQFSGNQDAAFQLLLGAGEQYELRLQRTGQSFEITDEVLGDGLGTNSFERRYTNFIWGQFREKRTLPPGTTEYPKYIYHPELAPKGVVINSKAEEPKELGWVDTPAKFPVQGRMEPLRSVLEAIRNPAVPELADLTSFFEAISLYREFHTGPESQTRNGISASADGNSLSEDGSNLARVVGSMQHLGKSKSLGSILQEFYPKFSEVYEYNKGGLSQVYVREDGVGISGAGLSDGTLQLLCLLVVLLNPTPPPLICIEEPERGLHPDAIRIVANLLIEASERTQLIVTTHSPALIDALSSDPESVVVCERDYDGFTQFKRLSQSYLDAWLEEYSLGELWQRGEIGGNRW